MIFGAVGSEGKKILFGWQQKKSKMIASVRIESPWDAELILIKMNQILRAIHNIPTRYARLMSLDPNDAAPVSIPVDSLPWSNRKSQHMWFQSDNLYSLMIEMSPQAAVTWATDFGFRTHVAGVKLSWDGLARVAWYTSTEPSLRRGARDLLCFSYGFTLVVWVEQGKKAGVLGRMRRGGASGKCFWIFFSQDNIALSQFSSPLCWRRVPKWVLRK